MKNIVFLILIIISSKGYSQQINQTFVNSGAISNNANCGIGEIFIISEPITSKSIIEEETSNVLFYPNPVKDILNISTDLEIKYASIFTIDGKLISDNVLFLNKQIDLSYLSTGTYVLVSNELKFQSIVIIKE